MTPYSCPHCKADLDAGPIPEAHKEHYSEPYRFSKVIGLIGNDRVMEWCCPECKQTWARDGSPDLGFRKCNVDFETPARMDELSKH